MRGNQRGRRGGDQVGRGVTRNVCPEGGEQSGGGRVTR